MIKLPQFDKHSLLKYEVLEERFPEKNVGVVKCLEYSLYKPWDKTEKEFLCLYKDKTQGDENEFEVYEAPDLHQLNELEEANFWKHLARWRAAQEEKKKKEQEAADAEERLKKRLLEADDRKKNVQKSYGDLFEESLTGGGYRQEPEEREDTSK